jgi:hypothetical protein
LGTAGSASQGAIARPAIRNTSEEKPKIATARRVILLLLPFAGYDEMICNLSNPPLSSVALNLEHAGYRAAEFLDALADDSRLPPRQILVEARWVVSRRSIKASRSRSSGMVRPCHGMTDKGSLQTRGFTELKSPARKAPPGNRGSTEMNDDCSLTEELRSLEEQLARPDVRRSPAELARLIADDFREFGSSGRAFDKNQIIAALEAQAACTLSIDDFQAKRLAADIALVTYRGTAQFAGSPAKRHSLRSSIWRFRGGKWEVIFHQGTPAEEFAPD